MSEQAADQLVKKYDANGDGFLSIDELASAWQSINVGEAIQRSKYAAPEFEQTTPMLVMPWLTFLEQCRIQKSTKKWRDDALTKGWLVEFHAGSGKICIFISHTW